MTDDTTRNRGRPASDYIYRFNIATDLTDDKRFIRFRRKLKIDEQRAYLTLTRFWNFVAKNYGVSGKIKIIAEQLSLISGAINVDNDSEGHDDTELIAEFCWYEGDARDLMNALRVAGFVEKDGTVHKWHENQPLAAKKARQRKSDQDEKTDDELSHVSFETAETKTDLSSIIVSPNPNPNPNPKGYSIHDERKETNNVDMRGAHSANDGGKPISIVDDLTRDTISACDLKKKSDIMKVRARIQKILITLPENGADQIRMVCAEIRDNLRDYSLKPDQRIHNPIAIWFHNTKAFCPN